MKTCCFFPIKTVSIFLIFFFHSYNPSLTGAGAFRIEKRQVKNDTDQFGRFNGGYDDDCFESTYLTPEKKMVKVQPDDDVVNRLGIKCHWNIITYGKCIPAIECKKFELQEDSKKTEEPCADEYFEVTDGVGGLQRYCGKVGPDKLSTSKEGLRDVFINYKIGKDDKIKRKLSCTVTCSEAHGKSLEVNFNSEVEKDCNCGRKPNKNRIVGGEDAVRGEFPWIVAMVTANTRKPFCGGTIINDHFIITAAHCFKGPYKNKKAFQLLANAHKLGVTSSEGAQGGGDVDGKLTEEELKEQDAGEGNLRFNVEKFFLHPLYVRQTNDFDVALIKTVEKIDFVAHSEIKPICFPDKITYNNKLDGQAAVVSGWGLNSSDATATISILQKLDVKVFSGAECDGFYGKRITPRMMCAGFKEKGKDSCKGDSGGPLIAEMKPQIWELIGTVSWGEGCAAQNSPGVYIKVSEIEQWIRYISNLEDAKWCAI